MSKLMPFMLLGAPQSIQVIRNIHRKEAFRLFEEAKQVLADFGANTPVIYTNQVPSQHTPISIGISMNNYDGTPIVPYDYSNKIYDYAQIPQLFHSLKTSIEILHKVFAEIFDTALKLEHEILLNNVPFTSQEFAEHLYHAYRNFDDVSTALLFKPKEHPEVEQSDLFAKIKADLEVHVALDLLNDH